MPFSNAYQTIQSSALTLLYAAVTLVQHGRFVGDAAACVPGVELVVGPPPAPPPQAVERIASTAMRTVRVFVIRSTFPVRYRRICGRQDWNRFSMRWRIVVRSMPVPAMR